MTHHFFDAKSTWNSALKSKCANKKSNVEKKKKKVDVRISPIVLGIICVKNWPLHLYNLRLKFARKVQILDADSTCDFSMWKILMCEHTLTRNQRTPLPFQNVTENTCPLILVRGVIIGHWGLYRGTGDWNSLWSFFLMSLASFPLLYTQLPSKTFHSVSRLQTSVAPQILHLEYII